MKKSLLLSIVMTLVLVVAMSTATFAWYTANSKAVANATTITAASAASNVYISLESENFTAEATEVTLAAMTAANGTPMAPVEKVTSESIAFKSATVSGGKYTVTDATVYVEKLYLFNDSSTAVATLIPTVTVAQNEENPDATSFVKYVLIADGVIIANNAYNSVAWSGENVPTPTAQSSTDPQEFEVGASEQAVVTLIVWLEGIDMDNTDQGKMADISVEFNAA